MESPQGSSFIPKQPARGKVQSRGVRKIYIFTYVSFVLFFGALIAAGGTFFYKVSVDAQLQAKKEELVKQRESFSEADIARIKELDKKLSAARGLLNNHVSVVSFFEALEQATLENTGFDGFSLTRDQVGGIAVELPAVTEDFNSVLFQKSVLDANPILTGADLEELTGSSGGEGQSSPQLATTANSDEMEVTFKFTKGLTASDIPYRPRNLNQSSQPAVSNQANTNQLSTDENLFVDDSSDTNQPIE